MTRIAEAGPRLTREPVHDELQLFLSGCCNDSNHYLTYAFVVTDRGCQVQTSLLTFYADLDTKYIRLKPHTVIVHCF